MTLLTFVSLSLPIFNDYLGVGETKVQTLIVVDSNSSAQVNPQAATIPLTSDEAQCVPRCHEYGHCAAHRQCVCLEGFIGDGRWCGKEASLKEITKAQSSSESLLGRPQATSQSPTLHPKNEPQSQPQQSEVTLGLLFKQSTGKRKTDEDSTLFELVLPLTRQPSALRIVTLGANADHVPQAFSKFPFVRTKGEVTVTSAWEALYVDSKPAWTIVIWSDWLHQKTEFLKEPAKDGDSSLRGTLGGLASLNASNPVLVGVQTFDSNMRTTTVDGFPAIERQSWLAACSVNAPFIASLGFLQLFFTHSRTTSLPEGPLVAEVGEHHELCSGNSTAALSSCLYEQYGMRCLSLAAVSGSQQTEQNEWTVWRRHSQWNCSLTIPSGQESVDSPKMHSVSAVCQQPLLNSPSLDSVRSKMAFAPDNTATHYREKLVPSEVASNDEQSANLRKPPVATGWVLEKGDSGADDPAPVVFTTAEVRDAVFVVGAGETVDPKPVELFIRSLRVAGSRAEVVFFVDARCSESFVPMAKRYGGVRLIEFDAQALGKAYHSSKPVVIYRFVLYEHFLRTRRERGIYRRCLHADLFDTYFQRDPFTSVKLRGGLAVFAENPNVPIGSCTFHRSWFLRCNEKFMLHRYHSVPRVCMGAVLGEYEPFINFLRLTVFRMLRYCNDQGVLNMLVWSGQYAEIMPVTIYTARKGPVFHANTEWAFSYVLAKLLLRAIFFLHSTDRYGDGGLVLNEVSKPYAIVHQWDRLFKSHSSGTALRFMRGGNVSKRKDYVQWYWSHPKRGGVQELIPDCEVLQKGVVACVSGRGSRHGTMHAVFCPTHTNIIPVHGNLSSFLPRSELDTDTVSVAAIRHVLMSPFLLCTSQAIIAHCVESENSWCTVSRKDVDRAVRGCAGKKAVQTDVKHADSAAESILYQCRTG